MAERDETRHNGRPSPVDPAVGRLVAWHHEMLRVHARLREALDVVRDAAAAGADVPAPERELLLFCHGFCHALSRHHAGEDDGLFPALVRRRPDLVGVVRRLEQDHSMIEHLLHGLRHALDTGADVATVDRHLEGVSAVMESHFRYEERELLGPLEELVDDGPALPLSPADAFGPLADGAS